MLQFRGSNMKLPMMFAQRRLNGYKQYSYGY